MWMYLHIYRLYSQFLLENSAQAIFINLLTSIPKNSIPFHHHSKPIYTNATFLLQIYSKFSYFHCIFIKFIEWLFHWLRNAHTYTFAWAFCLFAFSVLCKVFTAVTEFPVLQPLPLLPRFLWMHSTWTFFLSLRWEFFQVIGCKETKVSPHKLHRTAKKK